MRLETRFSGFGGQGVITAAIILGRAAAIYGQKHVVQAQSYGPEARGGASTSDVIISDSQIYYPKSIHPTYYVIMSELAYKKHGISTNSDDIMIIDPDHVSSHPTCVYYEVHATSESQKQFGIPLFANVIMLGSLVEATHIVDYQSLESALLDIVPKGTEDKNKQAISIGMNIIRDQKS